MAGASRLPADASYEDTARLSDGRRVRLRWLRPTDGPLIQEGMTRLSVDSRRLRFFVPLRELSEDMLRRLTQVDGTNHAALLATSLAEPGAVERGFGVARYVRSSEDPRAAELAVTVTDAEQRLGLGRVLVRALAEAALARGIDRFTMTVLSGNAAVRGMLGRLGAAWLSSDGDVSVYAAGTAELARRGPGELPSAA